MSKKNITNNSSQGVNSNPRKQRSLLPSPFSLLPLLCIVGTISLFFCISCPSPFSNFPITGLDEPLAAPQAPAGMGYFSLSVTNDSLTRSIQPAYPALDTLTYRMTFTPGVDVIGTPPNVPLRNFTQLGNNVLLYDGTWTLIVQAYADASGTQLVAEGDLEFSIGGGYTGGTVELKTAATGTGTFGITLNYPALGDGYTSVVIYPPSQDYEIESLSPANGTFTPVTLNAGYYIVDINLYYFVDEDEKIASLRRAIHIKPNLVTSLLQTFTASDFSGSLTDDSIVEITGNLWAGQTLTAETYNFGSSGAFHYRWYKTSSGTTTALQAGASNSYTITAADLPGSIITVEVNRAGYHGSKTSEGVTVLGTIASAVITVPVPVTNSASATAALLNTNNSTSSANYTITDVVWNGAAGSLTPGNPFETGIAYTVVVTLTAKSGYTFYNASENFSGIYITDFQSAVTTTLAPGSVNGSEGNFVTLSLEFPATSLTYVITGAGTEFTARLGSTSGTLVGTANQPIQTVIESIRTQAAEKDIEIDFVDQTTGVLDIGESGITFANVGTNWGKITLLGSLTSTFWANTIYVYDGVSVDVKGSVVNTADGGGYTIINGGNVTVSGGTVSSTTSGIAITNSSYSSYVYISSGKVEVAGATGLAIDNLGSIIISQTEGSTTIITSASTQGTINNQYGAFVTITGGTVENTAGVAIFNESRSSTIISQAAGSTTLITSANTNDAQGTIYNQGDGFVEITGGTVQNTAAGGRAIYNNGAGAIHVGGGTVRANVSNGRAIHNQAGGTVNVDAGRVEVVIPSGPNTGSGIAVYNNGIGTINISGTSTLEATGTTSGAEAIRNNGAGNVNISGGTISSNDYVINTNGGLLDISDGTVRTTSGTAVIFIQGSGSVNIRGGTITRTSAGAGPKTIIHSSSGELNISAGTVSASGDCIAISSESGTGQINITGGTVSAATGTAISSSGSRPINISGGAQVTAAAGIAIRSSSAGVITISGGTVTSANTNADEGTILLTGTITGERLVMSAGTVENTTTGANARAINNLSAADISISSGTVMVRGTGRAIHNNSTGALTITGNPRIEAVTADTGYAIYNTDPAAPVSIAPTANILGLVNEFVP